MSDLEFRLAKARERLVNPYTQQNPHRLNGFAACANIAREVVAEKDAEIARLEAAYHSETLLSNALAGALRERGYEHVWDAGTQRLTVTAVESCRECGEPPQSMKHRGSTGHQYFGPVS